MKTAQIIVGSPSRHRLYSHVLNKNRSIKEASLPWRVVWQPYICQVNGNIGVIYKRHYSNKKTVLGPHQSSKTYIPFEYEFLENTTCFFSPVIIQSTEIYEEVQWEWRTKITIGQRCLVGSCSKSVGRRLWEE